MKVLVKSVHDQLNFELEAESQDLISNLLQKISSQVSTPFKIQRLVFAGRVLEENWTLENCKIQNGSRLYLIERDLGIPIFLKSLSGRKIQLIVKLSDTLESLKEKVFEIEGIHPYLILNGKNLQGNHSLSDYHIRKDSVIFSVISIRGG